MKGLAAKIIKSLSIGSRLVCSDNSGAKEIEIIGVLGHKGARKRSFKAGICDIVIAAVKKGKPEMVKKVVRALVIRQRKEYKRANGMVIYFEDNAAVLLNEDNLPIGTEIKGVVAREVAERHPKVAAIASVKL